MNNFFTHLLWLALLSIATPAVAQLSELSGKYITAIGGEASTLTTNQWYLLYNRGRGTYAYQRSDNMIYVKNSDLPVVGNSATDKSAFLMRFVEGSTAEQIYIQTGNGRYFASLTQGGSNATTTEQSVYYTYGTISSTSGHFYFNDANGKIMDANGPGDASLAGWGNGIVTTLNGNNDWALYPVSIGEEINLTGEALLEYKLSNHTLFRLKNRNPYSNNWSNPLLSENTNNNLSIKDKISDSDLSQIWIIEPSGEGYTLKNANTGRYIQDLTTYSTSKSNPSSKVYYIKYSANNSDYTTNYITISSTSDFSGRNSLHQQDATCAGGGNNLVVWDAGTGGNHLASDWEIEPVIDITEQDVKNHFNEVKNIESEITSGAIYRIISSTYGSVITELATSNTLRCMPLDENNFAQYWRVIKEGSNCKLQNILTERYIQPQNGARSVPYSTGETARLFSLAEGADKWNTTFTIEDSREVGLHCASTQDNQVVGWDITTPASEWCMQLADITETEIDEARDLYNNYKDLKDNKSAIQSNLMTLFEDYSCTKLKSEYKQMSDEALTLAMEQNSITNPILQAMILKVKNESWQVYEQGWDITEKSFRVADYKVYSDWDWNAWTEIHRNGYCYSRLSNPTGINAKSGDVVTIFVGSDIPEGTTLQIEAVNGTSSAGVTTNLTKGLNTIFLSEDVNLFVYYTAEVTKTDGEYNYPLLSDIDDIKIHIEGGRVNGYFDLTKGNDNTDWNKLQSYLLKESNAVNLKTDYLLFNMNKNLVKQHCPVNIVELLNIWDKIVISQRNLMGLTEYEGYFNNLLVAASITNSYMYASSYGTYYEEGTLSNVMSYEEMNSTGAIWGPAHEIGHIHQNVINMVGCTEVSNNMFSNVAVYEQGRFTMRADEFSTVINNFASNTHWTARDIWEQCLMYTKLYYYYHVLGNNPDFYPNLYRALRNDPLDRRKNVTIRLKDESLKFYKYACDVAGEDLTEFFKVFGFFEVPQYNGNDLGYHKGDYGNFYVDADSTTALADIEEALQYIREKNYPKNNNLIFIDDRIRQSPASYEGMPAGAVRGNFNNDHPIGRVGDVGQYNDYTPEFKCDSYKYSLNNGSVTIEGEGSVGFKVYDQNGELVYVSNTTTFTIPENILTTLGTEFEIKAVEGNGSEVIVADSGKTLYTLNTYYGSDDMQVVYTNGEAPQLPDNAIAFISGDKRYQAPSTLKRGVNVIDADNRAERVEIKDNVEFYTPVDFTATQLNYDKEVSPNEISTLVLPFSTTATSLNGAVYEFDKVEENFANFTSLNGMVEANTPYLIASEQAGPIVISAEDVTIKATPEDMKVVKGNAEYIATYNIATPQNNTFKYYDGAFVSTSEEILPFEAMLKINNSSVYDNYTITFNGNATGVEEVEIDAPIFPADVYDLTGRLIRKEAISLKGLSKGIYVVNGKKFIWREK